jgi:mRNA interferase MazF
MSSHEREGRRSYTASAGRWKGKKSAGSAFGDWLVCGVTSQVHLAVSGFDELIAPQDSDFVASGLKTASLVRLGFLATLPTTSFLGTIGTVSAERHRKLLDRLAQHLQPGP